MTFGGNLLFHVLNQNNVGGIVDVRPAPGLLAAYPTTRVERTGRLKRGPSRHIGLAGWMIQIQRICHQE